MDALLKMNLGGSSSEANPDLVELFAAIMNILSSSRGDDVVKAALGVLASGVKPVTTISGCTFTGGTGIPAEERDRILGLLADMVNKLGGEHDPDLPDLPDPEDDQGEGDDHAGS